MIITSDAVFSVCVTLTIIPSVSADNSEAAHHLIRIGETIRI